MSQENWRGTYDSLSDWEKLLVSSGYEVGYEQGRRDANPEGMFLTLEQERIFLAAIQRRKEAAS